MTRGIVLGIGLCFNDHAPEQAAVVLAFHQPAAHQIGCNELGGSAKAGIGQGLEINNYELGGYEEWLAE